MSCAFACCASNTVDSGHVWTQQLKDFDAGATYKYRRYFKVPPEFLPPVSARLQRMIVWAIDLFQIVTIMRFLGAVVLKPTFNMRFILFELASLYTVAVHIISCLLLLKKPLNPIIFETNPAPLYAQKKLDTLGDSQFGIEPKEAQLNGVQVEVKPA